MHLTFSKYFFKYIVTSRSRQRLLIMSVIALAISSFSLMVLQSTMGGLQEGRINRSKEINGHGKIVISKNYKEEDLLSLRRWLTSQKVSYYLENEFDIIINSKTKVIPAVLHSLYEDQDSKLPTFFKANFKDELMLGEDLMYQLKLDIDDFVTITSPNHLDSFMGEVPKSFNFRAGNTMRSDVEEVDMTHAWTTNQTFYSIHDDGTFNRIVFTSPIPVGGLEKYLTKFSGMRLVTWEDQNSTLVWALQLESISMVFLFVVMTLLIALSISSGLHIFLGKIKTDLTSFWILGAGPRKLEKAIVQFVLSMNIASILFGLMLATIFLLSFDYISPEIMPVVFVDRKIPVKLTLVKYLISFSIPFFISLVFSIQGHREFRRTQNMLEIIRE